MTNRGRMLYMIMGTEEHSNNKYNIYIVAPLYVQCKAGWPMYRLDGSRFMTSSGLEQSFLLFVPGSFADIVEYHYHVKTVRRLGNCWQMFLVYCSR